MKLFSVRLEAALPVRLSLRLIWFGLVMLGIPAQAALITWDGGGVGGIVFTTPANWVGNTLPITSDDAVLDSSVVTIPSLLEVNAAITVGGIQFLSGFNGANTVTLGNGSGTARTLTLSSGSPNPLLRLTASSGTVTFDKRVNAGSADLSLAISGTGSFDVNSGATLVISNVISGTPTTLTKNGGGAMVLAGVNTLGTAATPTKFTITSGVLSINADSALGTSNTTATASVVTLNGGTLRHTSPSVGGVFINGNRGIAIGTNGGTIDIPSSTAILIYTNGQITGSGNTLTKSGAGTLRMVAPTSTTFTKLVVSGGFYQGALDTTFGAVPVSVLADQITLNGGGISANGGFVMSANRGITLGAAGGTINTPSSLTYGGPIVGTSKLTKTGVNTLTLNRATAYGPDFTLRIEAGTVDLNRGGPALSGILGAGNRVELAGGTLQLTASAQANYATTIAGLDIYSDSTVNLFRTTVNSQSPVLTYPLNFKANAKLSLTYNANITGNTTTFDGATNTLEGNAVFDQGAFNMTISNPIGETGGSYGITKLGAGQLNLNAINAYSGNTTNAAGVVALNSTSTFGNGVGTLVLAGGNVLAGATRAASATIKNPIVMTANSTIYGDGTLTNSLRVFPLSGLITMAGGTLTIRNQGNNSFATNNEFRVRLSAGGLSLTNPIVVGSVADLTNCLAELEFYGTNTDAPQSVSGNISGPGALYRSVGVAGTGGTTSLTGSNTYTGGTTVSGSTLLVNNATGSGTGTGIVTVLTSGTLGGTGIISGVVSISTSSVLAPGNSAIGTLTLGSVPVLNGTNYMEINKAVAPNADKLVLTTGTLAFGGRLTVTNIGAALTGGEVFDLFDAASFAGTFITNLPALSAGLNWVTNNLIVDGSIKVNRAPVATTVMSNCTPGLSLVIQITVVGGIATDADGDMLSVTVGDPSEGTNMVFTVGSDEYIYYQNTNVGAATDSFTYTVTDGSGGSDTKMINVTITEPNSASLNLLAGPDVIGAGPDVRLKFLTIPDYAYALEITHDLTPTITWTPLVTNTADATGLITYTNTPTAGPDYYRTRWVP